MTILKMDYSKTILFSDADMMVVNKPAGLRSIPDGYHPEFPHLKSVFEPEFGRLYIIHRLDKDTSGIILVARNPEFHKAINLLFDTHQVIKTYTGIILGIPPWNDLMVDEPLTVNGDRDHRTRVFPGKGKGAATEFHIANKLNSSAVLIAHPKTGYTHQIRAHLSYLGYPILFDYLYTPTHLRANANIIDAITMNTTFPKRTMLHAERISFLHPITQILTTYQAPIPPDMLDIISYLKK